MDASICYIKAVYIAGKFNTYCTFNGPINKLEAQGNTNNVGLGFRCNQAIDNSHTNRKSMLKLSFFFDQMLSIWGRANIT